MKQGLLLLLLLLPLFAQADGLAAAALAGPFMVYCVVSLVFVVLSAALAVVSIRRPKARGLLKWHGGLLTAIMATCATTGVLQFGMKPFLFLLAFEILLFCSTLVLRIIFRKPII